MLHLETFLVEWKLDENFFQAVASNGLETFLVEWKRM